MPKTQKTRHNARAHNDPQYEKRISVALEGFRSGKYRSLRQAAIAEKVKPRTLSDRHNGKHASTQTAFNGRKVLDSAQEQVLVDWIGHKAEIGLPMDYLEIQRYASSLAGRTVGKNWVARFLCKHPETVSRIPSKLDPKRAKNFNKTTIADFFNKLESLHAEYGNIPPEHIWNMDEKGIQLGGGRKNTNRKYVFLRSHRNKYRISSDNLELVTVTECVNAAGDSLPLAFVLTEGPKPDLDDYSEDKIASVSTSPSGWTDNSLTHGWMRDVFIPCSQAKRVDTSKPILLLCDGHGSHETSELQKSVYEVEGSPIIILCFPSKCTHKIQPLDVVVFAQTQRKWREHCDDCAVRNIFMNRYNVIQNYMEIREKHLFPEMIKKAFRKTGLFPVNRDIFTDEDFAPSKVTSTQVSVPDSFPEDIPSSDPAVPTDCEDFGDSDEEDADYRDHANCSEDDNSDSLATSDESDSSDSESDEDSDDENTLPGSPYRTRSTTPADVRDPPEFIAQCQRDITQMQRKHDIDKNGAELLLEVYALRRLMNLALDSLQMQYSLNQASDAHNTIIKRELENTRVCLDNVRKQKTRANGGSVKTMARFVTLPQLKESFRVQRAEREEKEKAEAAKKAQKAADKATQEAQVQQNARFKVFDRPLGSYTLKSDLQSLARAMGLASDGNIKDLRTSITEYMEKNSEELQRHQRFSGLFGRRRRLDDELLPSSNLPTHAPPDLSQPADVYKTAIENINSAQPPYFPAGPSTQANNTLHYMVTNEHYPQFNHGQHIQIHHHSYQHDLPYPFPPYHTNSSSNTPYRQ